MTVNAATFSEVLSSIDGLRIRLDSMSKLPSLGQNAAVVFGGVATILAVLLSVLAFAGDRFDGGLSATALLDSIVEPQNLRDSAQDGKLDSQNQKLDTILSQLEILSAKQTSIP